MADSTALDAALAQIDRAFGKNGTGEPIPQPATMTERVARVIMERAYAGIAKWEDFTEADREAYIEAAQDIFRAMSPPTDEMLDDIEGWSDKDQYQDLETDRERFAFVWETMLLTAEYELDRHELTRKARLAEAQGEWDNLSDEERARRTGPTPF